MIRIDVIGRRVGYPANLRPSEKLELLTLPIHHELGRGGGPLLLKLTVLEAAQYYVIGFVIINGRIHDERSATAVN